MIEDKRVRDFANNSILFVIDMQNAYAKGQAWECSSFEQSASNQIRLLKSGSVRNVLFTKYIASDEPVGVWKDYNSINAQVIEDSKANDMYSSLESYSRQYPCFNKYTYSAFKKSEIIEESSPFSCVAVSGVVAECCVLATVMDLIDAGKYVIYLTDAVSGVNRETEAAVITALEGLAYAHISFMTCDEYLHLLIN